MSTAPFAVTSDLEDRWRKLTAEEERKATVLLADASALLRSRAPEVDERIEAGTLDSDVPMAIVCAMVKRAMMPGSDDLSGITQQNQAAGPFQQSTTFANPLGDLYMTKDESRRLGIGRQRASSIDLLG